MDCEQRWIRKLKRNIRDPAANRLVAKYYKEMYAFIYKQTLDPELSLDLTQEIFISVLGSIKSFDSGKASFRTWLYKLASNRLVDYYRSKYYQYAKYSEPIDNYDWSDGHDMAVSLEYREDFERIASLVNRLDAGSQQIIRLKLFGEYTLQEIAASESLPLSTVKTRYYAALKWIRKKLEEDRHGHG
ncbi:RNA polymerase sigma factor [Paenibacillus sp. MSJ-34]|uniref:RNA polymerase sigma factor n=1 Tax=Paenibacillus sp. MSJ-34 TaxID=2841529 RepID=UPI001C11DFDE|nr:sigma-70 family RNA polymerase sigma factor [Paenibacillus sp. MSJ-34]MBU5444055.1 sigma-70 family RNA polymerase sigma factor [Paenibacillus sp. MSJ-34]